MVTVHLHLPPWKRALIVASLAAAAAFKRLADALVQSGVQVDSGLKVKSGRS